jgi:RNA polymerase sigma-70 factor (ECF subfamily)
MSTNGRSVHKAAQQTLAGPHSVRWSKDHTSDSAALHARLLCGDPTALEELAEVLLPLLRRQLSRAFTTNADDIVNDAVIDSLIEYGRNPSIFDPLRGRPLERFLYHLSWRNAADSVKARMRRVAREEEYARLITIQNHTSSIGGNGDTDTYSVESDRWRLLSIAATEPERAALRCWLDGERRTVPLAAALGAANLPISEKRREVKRFKDRVLKRLGRLATTRSAPAKPLVLQK